MKECFWLGLDDTDSPSGMCTTWLGALICHILTGKGTVIHESLLVRLNPTIPYKTRGNAAIAIRLEGNPEHLFELTCALVDRYADLACPNTHPGVVIFREKPPVAFYRQAVTGICTLSEAEDVISGYALFRKGYKIGRGLIGATAAVAAQFPDYTWELLMYRPENRWGTFREISPESVILSERSTTPRTWDSYDPADNSIVCVPRGDDPVLIGIRGESPFAVAEAATFLVAEKPDIVRIWKTNQGTDAHLLPGRIGALRDGHSYTVSGTVAAPAVTGEGGHVRLEIVHSDIHLTCMAYEPTKGFRHLVRSLVPGDLVIVQGSYLNGSLNLEKIRICRLAPVSAWRPPVCPDCGHRMTSAGAGKGYKCRRCPARSRDAEPVSLVRAVQEGWYEVPPQARRHLSMPLVRLRSGNGVPGLSIRRLREDEPVPISLLLLADERIEVVQEYLPVSYLFVAESGDTIVGEYVLRDSGDGVAEIMNIAVDPELQRRGIGHSLLSDATDRAKEMGFRELRIGTADIATRLVSLYESAGFTQYFIEKDYFIRTCSRPMYDRGVQLRDQVMLRKVL